VTIKTIAYFAGSVILAVCFVFATLSLVSRKQSAAGLQAGRLHQCPDSPNCVSSEHPHPTAYIEPFRFEISAGQAMQRIRQVIVAQGGQVMTVRDEYIHAIFVSKLFRFIDDVEIRLDADSRQLHVRSASRVGHSDLGMNRQRIERLRTAFHAAQS